VSFGPDGKLYVAVGSSCNFCLESDDRRAAITVYDADGSNRTLFARGLRNAVGLAWHPLTGELWATDNGGDGLGDNDPPEEVNIVAAGTDYGWPDCVAQQRGVRWGNQARPDRCGATHAPEVEMQAHSAPLGISFYTGDQFPLSFRNDALVAFHGSWNRSTPTGYKVVRIRTADGRATGVVEDFLWGFLNPETRTESGRPVQAITGPDGSVYVSDDETGNIYRVEYKGPRIDDGGVSQVDGQIYSIKGRRLAVDPAQVQVFGNGIALEVVSASDREIGFVLPESLRGEIGILVRNEMASDESRIFVE
jgi:glucose/arabinose dehydrogenase